MREVKIGTIRVLERAIDILQAFDLDHSQLSIDEIAKNRITQLNRISHFMYIRKRGFVQYDERSATYQLGWQLMELGTLASSNYKIQRIAEEDLNELQNKTRQTVIMAVKIGDEILYVYSKENPQGLKYSTPRGKRRPLTFGLLGPVLLAFSSRKQIERVLRAPIPKHTPYTITDKEKWYEILEKIRNDKYYIDINLTTIGVAGVAVPIFDEKNEVIAAVGILGPLFQVEDQLEEFKLLLRETVGNIAHNLTFNK